MNDDNPTDAAPAATEPQERSTLEEIREQAYELGAFSHDESDKWLIWATCRAQLLTARATAELAQAVRESGLRTRLELSQMTERIAEILEDMNR